MAKWNSILYCNFHNIMNQSYHNHTRHDAGFYLLMLFCIAIGMTMRYVGHQISTTISLWGLENIIPFVAPVFFMIIIFQGRRYSTKLQDRIIRQEENFRHYLITWKPLDPKLTTEQIVALRFASDEEFVALTQKAINESLTNKQIKQLIKNRKGDYLRV